MASLLSLFGVILWSFAAFRPRGETLDTLPSHRSEVVSSYSECLLRASHGHMRHLMETQPVTQRQQIGGHSAKGAHEPLARAILLAQQHTGHDRLFVNVQATTPRIEYLHTVVPFWAASERCEGDTSFAYVLTEGSGQQSSIRERTRISFLIGLAAPKCHDLVSLAPPQYATFSSASLSGTDIALHNSEKVE